MLDAGKGSAPWSQSRPPKGRFACGICCCVLPFLAMFWVSSYNRVEPAWGGIPFFYWYQLLWIPIGAGLTLIVYFATHR